MGGSRGKLFCCVGFLLFNESGDQIILFPFLCVFTARKRSLRRLCFYRCLSFCPQGEGACVVAPGGGMRGCSWGVCVVAPGPCVVAPRGGMRGCSGGVCVVAPGGACVVAPGGHAWFFGGGVRGFFGGTCVFFSMRYGQ